LARVGTGYDVHRLVPGRRLVLGGVEIPHALGLDGHSDADIGQHFPPSDDRWRGADSLDLLRRVVGLVAARGYRVGNVDVTVVAEQPKIGPHAASMRERIADALGVRTDDVSIKATTNEHLGFVGRQEGIAAIATAMIEPL
jgi:2-C-methyl-D-erythritol 2,4-cyclodiphosphate synthase